MISFVGAGPGAPDLLTLRAAQRLSEAEVVIWAASLVPEAILVHCRPGTEIHDSKSMTLEEVTAIYAAYPRATIVRLHSGDPTLYGAIAEQIDWCLAHERTFEIVPGVSSMAAAAAAIGRELTLPAVSQSVVMTRLAKRTKASMSPGEGVAAFAVHGVTMAVFLSASHPEELQDELLVVGSAYAEDTPAIIAHRVSWPDEQIVQTCVGELAASLVALGASTTVVVLVGPALGVAPGRARSHVYSPSYGHSFRPATPDRTAPEDDRVVADRSAPDDGSIAEDGATPDDGSIAEDGATPDDGSFVEHGCMPDNGPFAQHGCMPDDGSFAQRGSAPDDGPATHDV